MSNIPKTTKRVPTFVWFVIVPNVGVVLFLLITGGLPNLLSFYGAIARGFLLLPGAFLKLVLGIFYTFVENPLLSVAVWIVLAIIVARKLCRKKTGEK